jgi:hypothetical protein
MSARIWPERRLQRVIRCFRCSNSIRDGETELDWFDKIGSVFPEIPMPGAIRIPALPRFSWGKATTLQVARDMTESVG